MKKILLGFAALLFLAVAVVGWTVARPIYGFTQQIVPSTAPEDYAQQDDSRVQLPKPRELEPRPAASGPDALPGPDLTECLLIGPSENAA